MTTSTYRDKVCHRTLNELLNIWVSNLGVSLSKVHLFLTHQNSLSISRSETTTKLTLGTILGNNRFEPHTVAF